ncbi:MAG: hypothetical protein ACE5IK_06800 [Acidobacteriota bacterium]
MVSVDRDTGEMALSFMPACDAVGHHIEFGPLAGVAAADYTGQVCGAGTSGSIASFQPGTGSVFFIVVGDDDAGVEGSYGLSLTTGLFAERPEDVNDPACAFVRDLARTCDLPTSPGLDITAFRPQSEAYGMPLARRAVPAVMEISPGVGIRINGDDDDASGVADGIEVGVAWENDLVEMTLSVSPPVVYGVEPVLARSGNAIRVWLDPGKNEPLLIDAAEVALPFSGVTRTVWVENPAGGVADLELISRAVSSGAVLASSTVHLVPFAGTVIVLGGEGQVPADPPLEPGNHGMFSLAIELQDLGYDVHMYDEDVVSPAGTGAAYDEVVRAVMGRGVTGVAIFGYSHGGGSTNDLAVRLDQDRLAIGSFAIDFTAYVDGIDNDSDIDVGTETALPPATAFHANYYENPGCGFFQLCGGPIAGADLNVNVTSTPWGAALTHFTIDDAPMVLHGIRDEILARVPR